MGESGSGEERGSWNRAADWLRPALKQGDVLLIIACIPINSWRYCSVRVLHMHHASAIIFNRKCDDHLPDRTGGSLRHGLWRRHGYAPMGEQRGSVSGVFRKTEKGTHGYTCILGTFSKMLKYQRNYLYFKY